MDNDRRLLTKHGLHLNGCGKEHLSKRIVSPIYSILGEEKTDPPITLDWINTHHIAITALKLKTV
jgi:hypothetical protein